MVVGVRDGRSLSVVITVVIPVRVILVYPISDLIVGETMNDMYIRSQK